MNNPQQPKEYDAVLGGNSSIPENAAVLGGIEGVKLRLQNPDLKVRSAAIKEAFNYGEQGLDLLIQVVKDKSLEISTDYEYKQEVKETSSYWYKTWNIDWDYYDKMTYEDIYNIYDIDDQDDYIYDIYDSDDEIEDMDDEYDDIYNIYDSDDESEDIDDEDNEIENIYDYNDVLGGIEGVKLLLQNPDSRLRIAALEQALNYGEQGLNLVLIEGLNDESIEVQNIASLVLDGINRLKLWLKQKKEEEQRQWVEEQRQWQWGEEEQRQWEALWNTDDD
ncbi:MAG: hypothetical protein ACKPJH_21880 [Dolichospermum sp.]